MNFANNLKQLRQGRHMTQEALARYLNVTRPTIAGYETKNKQPDYDKLQKIAEYFEVSIDYLLTGNETSVLVESDKPLDSSQTMLLEKNLLKYFSQLSSSSKQELVNFSKFLYLQEHNRLKLIKKIPVVEISAHRKRISAAGLFFYSILCCHRSDIAMHYRYMRNIASCLFFRVQQYTAHLFP